MKTQSRAISKKVENTSPFKLKPNQERLIKRPRTPRPSNENPIKSDW